MRRRSELRLTSRMWRLHPYKCQSWSLPTLFWWWYTSLDPGYSSLGRTGLEEAYRTHFALELGQNDSNDSMHNCLGDLVTVGILMELCLRIAFKFISAQLRVPSFDAWTHRNDQIINIWDRSSCLEGDPCCRNCICELSNMVLIFPRQIVQTMALI